MHAASLQALPASEFDQLESFLRSGETSVVSGGTHVFMLLCCAMITTVRLCMPHVAGGTHPGAVAHASYGDVYFCPDPILR